jgi:hypothetical protein
VRNRNDLEPITPAKSSGLQVYTGNAVATAVAAILVAMGDEWADRQLGEGDLGDV